MRKKDIREIRIDRNLRRAAHERRQKNCHLPVSVRRKRTGTHDSRNRASEAYQHRNDTAAGETDLSQRLIHDEGNAGHIAAVFKNGKKEEQNDDDRNEGKHCPDTIEDAVDDQRMQSRIHLGCSQCLICD